MPTCRTTVAAVLALALSATPSPADRELGEPEVVLRDLSAGLRAWSFELHAAERTPSDNSPPHVEPPRPGPVRLARRGGWTRLAAVLENRGRSRDVLLVAGDGVAGPVVRRRLSLPRGARKRVALDVPAAAATAVSVTDTDGRELASAEAELDVLLPRDVRQVLVVVERDRRWRHACPVADGAPGPPTAVAAVTPDALPRSLHALDGADLVLLTGSAIQGLDVRQQRALLSYAARGAAVVASLASGSPAPGPLAAALPATPEPARAVSQIQALTHWTGVLHGSGAGILVRPLRPLRGASVVSEGETLGVARLHGNGALLALGVPLDDPTLATWPGWSALVRRWLALSRPPMIPLAGTPEARELDAALTSSLPFLRDRPIPSRGAMAAALLAACLATVATGLGLAGRRLGRRPLAALAAAALAGSALVALACVTAGGGRALARGIVLAQGGAEGAPRHAAWAVHARPGATETIRWTREALVVPIGRPAGRATRGGRGAPADPGTRPRAFSAVDDLSPPAAEPVDPDPWVLEGGRVRRAHAGRPRLRATSPVELAVLRLLAAGAAQRDETWLVERRTPGPATGPSAVRAEAVELVLQPPPDARDRFAPLGRHVVRREWSFSDDGRVWERVTGATTLLSGLAVIAEWERPPSVALQPVRTKGRGRAAATWLPGAPAPSDVAGSTALEARVRFGRQRPEHALTIVRSALSELALWLDPETDRLVGWVTDTRRARHVVESPAAGLFDDRWHDLELRWISGVAVTLSIDGRQRSSTPMRALASIGSGGLLLAPNAAARDGESARAAVMRIALRSGADVALGSGGAP